MKAPARLRATGTQPLSGCNDFIPAFAFAQPCSRAFSILARSADNEQPAESQAGESIKTDASPFSDSFAWILDMIISAFPMVFCH